MNRDEAQQKLEEYRVTIDDLDRRIVDLLNERTRVVEDIGRVKRSVRRIYERIIDEMRMIQRVRMEEDGDN